MLPASLRSRVKGVLSPTRKISFVHIAPHPRTLTHTVLESIEMSALTDVIQIIPPDRIDDPEDIFAAAPGLIFTDDLRNSHGDPGSTIVYKSKRFGSIELKTADPQAEDERQLFSHYLWNAGIKLAEIISQHSVQNGEWTVEGEKVLELGAGA